jgi:hypothetical protein
MSGPKLFHRQSKDSVESDRWMRSLAQARASRLLSYFLAGAIGTSTIASGMNINNFGLNSAMAQTASGRVNVPKEDIKTIEKKAVEATEAFRAYIKTGDERQRDLFWKIYNTDYKGTPYNQLRTFTKAFYDKMDAVVNDPAVASVYEAFKANAPFGPAVFTDFIEAVYQVRTTLAGAVPQTKEVEMLIGLVEAAKDKPVKTGSDIARVRELMENGMDITSAARRVLMQSAVDSAAAIYGKELTDALRTNIPSERAAMAVDALKGYVLTGEPSQLAMFEGIWYTNESNDTFKKEFIAKFKEQIFEAKDEKGDPTPLSLVAQSYHAAIKIDPLEFATFVKNMYNLAATGTADEVDAMMVSFVRSIEPGTLPKGMNAETAINKMRAEVVEPLLDLVAKGKARQAIEYMRQVLQTGDAAAAAEFARIYDGKFLGEPIEYNTVFKAEFNRLYKEEIRQSEESKVKKEDRMALRNLVASFERNVLPIAIRDIYTELLKANPDMNRLETLYGSELVTLVSTNASNGNLGWIVREGTDLSTQLERRAALGDQNAIAIKGYDLTDRVMALSRTYAFLAKEKALGRSLEDYKTLDENFEQLSWLSGTPQQVQRELTTRARQNDAFAIAFLSTYPTNAGQTLSTMYNQLRQLRQEAGITQNGFVSSVAANMEGFQWVVKPVASIGNEMKTKRYEPAVATIHQTAGFAYGTFAVVLKEIYTELGKGTPDRKKLVDAYGEGLVSLVETNRADLKWLSGNANTIEGGLRIRNDDLTKQLKRYIRSYNPVMFVASVATARTAAMQRGIVRADALDALGFSFLEPAAAKEAEIRTPIIAEGLEDRRRVVEARWKTVENGIADVERQLNHDIPLKPAKAMLGSKMARWRAENERIRTDARSADSAELDRLEQEQTDLIKAVVSGQELRKAVEMAFAMIHLSETGTDISGTIGTATTGTMGVLLKWYESLEGTGKQAVIGDVVFAVLGQARPELQAFIGSMNDRGFFQAITVAYAMTQGRGGMDRAGLMAVYGPEFVSLVEQHAADLKILESTGVVQSGMTSMALDQNELFAAIVIRCYRAIATPQGTENRETMVGLFGEEFVTAVEKNKSAFASLGRAGAGLSDVMAAFGKMDENRKTVFWGAYSSAYDKSVGRLMQLYRNQDEALFNAMSNIYGVLIRPPREGAPKGTREEYSKNVANLRTMYGDELVASVAKNLKALRFLESPMATSEEMRKLDPAILTNLNDAFEKGPGVSRTNFMTNFRHVADIAPRVYLQIKNAMAYNNPTDQLGLNFTQAVGLYRQEFGANNYLFNQYVNMPLLNDSLVKLAKFGKMPASIKTPEEMATFLSSEEGQQLIATGRKTFENIKTEYLMQRQRNNYNPESRDFSNEAVATLTNELSILDGLYIGVALTEIQGTASAFGPRAASEFMNTLLVIAHRDPYLVGSYILQVVPALIQVSQDEETLAMGMMAFRTIFTTRYAEGLRGMSYSTAIIRQYFLDYFKNIDAKLPEIVSTFDHSNIEDELRQVPEARTNEGFLSPMYYRYKPGWREYEGKTIPTLFGQPGEPLNLLPQPTMPAAPYNPVPGRGLTLDSDAMGLFSRIYDQLRPPTDRMFNYGVPARFRIGALGISTIIRRLNELAGPMPVDYQDYWLSKQVELGMFYAAGGAEVQTSDTTTGVSESQAGGGGAAGVVRGITGGAQMVGTAEGRTTTTKQVTTEGVTGAAEQEGPPAPAYSSTTVRADVRGQAAGVPGQPVPLPLLGLYPGDVFDRGNEVGIHNAQQEFHYESTSGTMEVPGTDVAGGPETKEVKTVEKTGGVLSTYQRIAKENKTDMLLYVSGEYVPELRGPARKDVTMEDLTGMGVEQDDLPASTDQLNQDLFDMDHGEDAEAKAAAADRVEQALEGMGITLDEVNNELGKREGQVLQEEQGRMKGRLYFITQEGNIYQLAYGYDTEAKLNNYMFAGMNRQDSLLSMKFIGRDMWVGMPLSDAEYMERAAEAMGVDKSELNELTRNEIKRRLLLRGIDEDQITKGVAGGFDGAAVGFTLPRGSDEKGDTFAALAFGELVRNLQTMDPVHAEQAVGLAVTNMLESRAQRDIYAAFYRGAEIVQLKADDRTQLDTGKTEHAQTTVDVMWRRMRIDPLEKAWEIRAVGGYPTTAGVMGKLEVPQAQGHMHGYGATAVWNEVDLLREFRVMDADAEGIYSTAKSMLVQLYGYTEDKATNAGLLIAFDYMYSRLEDRIGSMGATESQKEDLTQHYATLLIMAWANRHGFLVGGQRVPGYTNMNRRINQAMLEIQNNPNEEESILTNLAEQLRNDFQENIWRFSLGYGYNGDQVRLYTVASAQFTENIADKQRPADEEVTGEEDTGAEATTTDTGITPMPENMTSGNLSSLFLFGRPTRGYGELGTHFYGQSPLVIGRTLDENGDPAGAAVVSYDPATPFVDLYGAVGLMDVTSLDLMRYERKVTIRSETDPSEALRDAYREVGSSTANDQRIRHLYGGAVVDAVAEGKESLEWMVKPSKEIAKEIKQKLEEEDPVVRSILARRYGDRMGELTNEDYAEAADMIRDIYLELRKTSPDTKRLQEDYKAEVVDVVASRTMDLDWVLLPPDTVRAEFAKRARKEGSVEQEIAAHASLAEPPHGTKLTGTEVQKLCEHNLVPVILGITNSESAVGLGADKYDVILAGNLRDEEEKARMEGKEPKKRDTFYVLMSPAAAFVNSKGSIFIGNEDDLKAWGKPPASAFIGRGVSRLDIKADETNPKDYNFVFSGDRRLTAFSAFKLVGGITLPLEQSEYARYRAEDNWTIGGIVHLLQDHQNDWLVGALYGLRGYGDQKWEQLTVTSTMRHQLTNTATYSDQLYWYVFFNQMTKKITLASSDVWNNEDELRQVCAQLGGCTVEDLRRTTGGGGVTWARTDVITGETLSLHFFFEGGTEQRRQYRAFGEAADTEVVTDLLGQWSSTEFIFRSGLAFGYQRQAAGSLLGEKYTLGITGARGSWPIVPGQITRPEYFGPWANDTAYMGWFMMLYGQIEW